MNLSGNLTKTIRLSTDGIVTKFIQAAQYLCSPVASDSEEEEKTTE